MGKILKTNIILITKKLNINWNIVKSFIFDQKMIDFKSEFFKIVIDFRWMLCAQLNSMLHHFTI